VSTTAPPERIRWAVDMLELQPAAVVLEIGCGRGVAVELICDRLADGHILAIDRSPTMIERAQRRNSDCVAAGRASFRLAPLESAELDEAAFSTIFAINVNLFWVRDSGVELAVIARSLLPDGRLFLFYEPPSVDQVAQTVETLSTALERSGFDPTITTDGRLLCVSGSRR
jgi:trans-aconitate methyltransferase